MEGHAEPIQKAYSARSKDAFYQLDNIDEILTSKEAQFDRLNSMAMRNPPRDIFLQIKNELALLIGEVDKIQMAGIDSILVCDLASGKDEARNNRKKLNKRVQVLSDELRQLHTDIVDYLAELE